MYVVLEGMEVKTKQLWVEPRFTRHSFVLKAETFITDAHAQFVLLLFTTGVRFFL